LFGLYVASKALPETEACVQQPGTVRGADGSRLKQKPASYEFQASLACVLGSVCERGRRRYTHTQRAVWIVRGVEGFA
jgi:hypothetical protein